MIYLDAAATSNKTQFDEAIINAMTEAMREYWMNPNSLYASKVRARVDECRRNIAKTINAEPDEIYFTSGASESNNWAIRGWVDNWIGGNYMGTVRPHVITTSMEHKSISTLMDSGIIDVNAYVQFCGNDENGLIDYASLVKSLQYCGYDDNPVLVSICMANNEIGTIQDIMSISKLVHKHKGVLHMDATQAYCKMSIDVKYMGIDMMSVSGHKLSPTLRGIGFLYKKNGVNIDPLIYGAQERGLRGGTENVAGIVGLNEALKYCSYDSYKAESITLKRNYLIDRLKTEFDCKLNGDKLHRLCNNVNVTFPQNITGEALLYMLDMSDIKIATGSACNSADMTPSHVLKAIGLSDEEAMRTIRISIDENTTWNEINKFIEELRESIEIIESES